MQKVNPYIREAKREVFKFTPNEEIMKLTNSQKINQRIVLSFYGKKIDMPFKFVSASNFVEVIKDVAQIPGASHEVMEAYRLEITHPLGKMFCRFDIPKKLVASVMTADAFSLAELNIRAKREFEDYLISRKQYDIEFSQMDLSHRQARLARKYEWINQGIGLVMDLATAGVMGIKGATTIGNLVKHSMNSARAINRAAVRAYGKKIMAWPDNVRGWSLDDDNVLNIERPRGKIRQRTFAPISFKNMSTSLGSGLAAYKGFSGTMSGIAGLASIGERAALQEEGFGIEVREKALRSYSIDLGFERDKDEQLFTMRRIFAGETYNEITDRQKQQVLDELENPAITDEIYLEVWTTSGEQKNFIDKYHDKYGVDCRVVKKEIPIRDDMRKGIYCVEDVEIFNLTDRVDFEYLKTRLTGGIKFIEWEEFKGEKEFHPVDERIKELQAELVSIKRQHQEADALTQETLTELRSSNTKLHNQVSVDADKYHELSENYKKKEAELQTQTNLVTLYKNEADHFKADLLKKDSEHAQEKEDHSGTKQQLESKSQQLEEKTRELEQKKQENQTLTSQIDSQLVKIQECEREKTQMQQQLTASRQEKEEQQRKIQTLEQEVQSNKDKEQQIKQLQAELAQLKKKPRIPQPTAGDDSIEDLYKQIDQKNQELSAVREIEAELRQKVTQLEEQKDTIRLPLGFINNLLYEEMPLRNKPNQGYFAKLTKVVKKGNDYVVLQWDPFSLCFEQLRNYIVIGNYSYRLFTIAHNSGVEDKIKMSLIADDYYTYDASFKLNTETIRRKATGYWQYYSSSFDRKKETWASLGSDIFPWTEYYKEKDSTIWQIPLAKQQSRTSMASIYIHPVMFCEHEWTLPYFSEQSSIVKNTTLPAGRQQKRVGEPQSLFGRDRGELLLNETPVYWDKKKMCFTKQVTDKRISNYGDYCDVLGISCLSVTTYEELQERKNIAKGGA